MIFTNPSGAPELACDECGCRWFDRMCGACYECGTQVTPDAQVEFRRALEVHAAARRAQPLGAPGPTFIDDAAIPAPQVAMESPPPTQP